MCAKFLTSLLICAAAPLLGEELVLDLDPAQTTVRFTLSATLHTVHGSFKLKRGTIHFDPASGRIAGEVVVDATSGDSHEEGRDRKMHKDVLESRRYPEIVFTPDQVIGAVAPQGVSQVQVHGVFRIHGAAHEIVLPVEVHITGGHITAAARFTIPYVKWGMKNPSSLLLRVSDKVEIEATAATR
jgi:polyisoprenoid-binding protein YceI